MHVIHIITSLDDGGAEGALFRLIESTRPAINHRVICLMGPGKYGPKLEQLGVPTHFLNMTAKKAPFVAAYQLRQVLSRHKTQDTVIQTWLYHADLIGGLAAKTAGIKDIFWGIRNSHIKSNPTSTKIITKTCALLSTLIPTKIISCSHKAVDYHQRIGYRGSFTVIPNGYKLDDFNICGNKRQEIRAEFSANNKLLLGIVARWHPAKDHETLLRAISIWSSQSDKEFLLLLVGKNCTNQNKTLIDLIKKYNLSDKIKLTGARTDIPAIMNALDLHLLTSQSEAFPNVIAEAMACGTPCVSTDVGDIADIVGDLGWFSPAGNSDQFAQVLSNAVTTLDDELLAKKLSLDCRKRIEKYYSIEKMAKSFEKAWSQ